MAIKLNLRTIVVMLFICLYMGSLILFNNFFIHQQKKFSLAMEESQIGDKISRLKFSTHQDSLLAKEHLNEFQEILASVKYLQNETQIYSAIVFFFLMIFSIAAFSFILYKITEPLKELNHATIQIRNGDFNVRLSTKGIPEMKQLKQSFNRMSRELEIVQQKLLNAEKEVMWKELSRVLAHEIKNPLTPIQLSIQRLEDKFESDPDKFRKIFPEAASVINQEINNLRDLVKSFSDFARPQEAEVSVFNPGEYIQEIIKSYQHRYKIITELESVEFRFDQTHFYQIVTNILQNAIEASPPDETITIKLFLSKSFLVLQVIDKGHGINKDDLPRIFEPYFSRKRTGTGLGLALVKKLVEANGAYIRVHSKPGEGTTFEIIMDSLMHEESTERENGERS